MKNKQIIDSWNKIEPDSAADARMLGAILSLNRPNECRKASIIGRIFSWKRLASVVACLAVTAAIAIPLLHDISGSNLPGQDTPPANLQLDGGNPAYQAPSDGVSSMFGGFLLTAYAAKTEEQTLTADYLSETVPVVLQPDVQVALASYSPSMSCVPGLPFTFGIADTAYKALPIRVSVDGGELLKWDLKTGVITQYGRFATCMNGETLYWSPMGQSGEAPFMEAVITVEVIDGNAVLGKQEIAVTSNNYVYWAKAGKLERI